MFRQRIPREKQSRAPLLSHVRQIDRVWINRAWRFCIRCKSLRITVENHTDHAISSCNINLNRVRRQESCPLNGSSYFVSTKDSPVPTNDDTSIEIGLGNHGFDKLEIFQRAIIDIEQFWTLDCSIGGVSEKRLNYLIER